MVNIVSRWLYSFMLPYETSIVLAFLTALLTGFLLFKFFVFHSGRSKRVFKETVWYVLVNLFALLQTLLISVGLAEYLFPAVGMRFHPHDIAHVVGVSVPVITSYFGHKYLTFK